VYFYVSVLLCFRLKNPANWEALWAFLDVFCGTEWKKTILRNLKSKKLQLHISEF